MRKRRGANKGAGEEARGRRWCAPTSIFAEILPGFPFPKQAEEERKQSPHPASPSSLFPVLTGFSLHATPSNEVVWKGFWENQDVWVLYPCSV